MDRGITLIPLSYLTLNTAGFLSPLLILQRNNYHTLAILLYELHPSVSEDKALETMNQTFSPLQMSKGAGDNPARGTTDWLA